jgi:alpha-L-fucosidase
MSNTSNPHEVLNLQKDRNEFVLRPGVGFIISYHGTVHDTRKMQRAAAEQIAKDPAARYLTYASAVQEQKVKEAQAAAANRQPASGKSGK